MSAVFCGVRGVRFAPLPIEQLKILQTSLDFTVFPEPILSSADVVQHILDFVVAKRLPRVVIEGPVLYVSRELAHPVSMLLVLTPLPNVPADLQGLDLLPEKIEISVPSVFEKIAHLLLVRVVELASAPRSSPLHYVLPKQ